MRKNNAAVTIRDIAAKLHISHATVSRSLADNPRISVKMRSQVKATALRLGYVPNAAARAIQQSHSTLTGLVVPDIKNDFYASIAKTMGERLVQRGLQLVLCVTEDDPSRELSAIRALAESRAAGVVVALSPTPDSRTIELLADNNVVQLVRSCRGVDSSAVLIDDAGATATATQHLVALGHQRLAYVGGFRELSSGRERLRGFMDAVAGHRLISVAKLGPPRPSFATQVVIELMTSVGPPTGIVFGSSELTLGGLQALATLRIRYPDKVSVVGFGDPAWCNLNGVGISTIRLAEEEMGQMAAQLLIAGIDESRDSKAVAVRKRFTPVFIPRQSSGPPPK